MAMRIFILLLILMSSYVHSEPQWCSGLITHTYVTGDGVVVIRGEWRMEHTAICNINVARSGVSPEVCKGWLSMVMSAKLSKTEMTAYYDDVDSCQAIPAYAASPAPGYLMLSEK